MDGLTDKVDGRVVCMQLKMSILAILSTLNFLDEPLGISNLLFFTKSLKPVIESVQRIKNTIIIEINKLPHHCRFL